MPNELQPWEIQDTESSAAYEAFSAYLAMPRRERSVLIAYKRTGGTETAQQAPGQWKLWATTHRWVERARAWDAHRARVEREARAEADLGNLELRDRVAKGLLIKLAQAMAVAKPKDIKPGAWGLIARAASDMFDTARVARAELTEAQAETLPTDGYDVLDALRQNADVTPLLLQLQDAGVDLEPDPGDDGPDPERGEVDAGAVPPTP